MSRMSKPNGRGSWGHERWPISISGSYVATVALLLRECAIEIHIWPWLWPWPWRWHCSELGVGDLRRRVLVTLWQTSQHDPQLDRLVGATSFGVLNVACNKTVSNQTFSLSSPLSTQCGASVWVTLTFSSYIFCSFLAEYVLLSKHLETHFLWNIDNKTYRAHYSFFVGRRDINWYCSLYFTLLLVGL